jgi:uncharacterized membrane protein YebE (DUF533 family)
MNLDELGEDAKKQNILSIMLTMSKVDNVIHDNEMMYIIQLGLNLGMKEESIREIAHNESPSIFVPTLETDRLTILYYLIFLIKSDGVISEEEKDMLHHFGLKLGFNHLMVANIIRVVQANLGKRLPPNALIEEVRKYLN